MQKHTHYDAADLPAIEAVIPHVLAQTGNMQFREDAGIFTARELDYVKAQVYGKLYPEMKGLSLIPVSSDAPEWAETVTYIVYDDVGMAKIIANYADDLPRADVKGAEHTARVKVVGDSYGYNFRELAASMATGRNLPMRKADAARRAVDVKLNSIAIKGDALHGLYGLTNHPNIGVTTLPSAKNWVTGSPTVDELIADVHALYDAVRVQSNGVHTPTKILLPTSRLNVLKRTLIPNTGAKSVLAYLKEEYPALEFVDVPELENTGTGGKGKIFIGEFNEVNINHEMPMQFTQHPAETRGLEVVVACTAATAGVLVHYPLAFTTAEA